MSQDNNTNDVLNKFLAKWLKWCLILDGLWAAGNATMVAIILNQSGQIAGADTWAIVLGTIISWLLAFVVAAFQGAIFLIVLSVFLLFCLLVWHLLTANQKPR